MTTFLIQNRLRNQENGDGNSGGGGGNVLSGDQNKSTNSGDVNIPDNWINAIPEDLRTEPSFKNFKPGKEGFTALAKSFVNAQKMVGMDKIVRPKPDSPKEVWDAFYEAAGRPQTAADYKLELPDNLKELKLDDSKLEKWKTLFHESGVPQGAFGKIMTEYLSHATAEEQAAAQTKQQQEEAAFNSLRQEYGDSADANFNMAGAFVAQYGGEEAQKFFKESGLGNNPTLIKIFVKAAQAVMEDKAAGEGMGQFMTDKTRAQAEIKQLKADKDFQGKLLDRSAVGHKEALVRWQNLHNVAFKEDK